MNHPLGTLARTHTCGALTAADVGKDVVLLGWVHRIRDLGALVFIDVRDRHGITQVVVRDDEALVGLAERLRAEYVIAVLGHVEARSPETVNPKVSTGAVEIRAREIPAAERRQDAAVLDRRRVAGVRGHAAEVPLPRPAALAHAEQHRAAAPRHDGSAEVF